MMTALANQPTGSNVYFQQWVGMPAHYRALFAGLGAQAIAQVETIFIRNCASGRAQRVMGQPPGCAHFVSVEHDAAGEEPLEPAFAPWALDYLQKVIAIYRQEAVRVQALANGDPTAWDALSPRLVDSAYKFLLRKGINLAAAAELAPDMAQQTCLRIYLSYFPCDVAFDTWAHVILKNQILQTFTRSRDLLDRQPYIESLDEFETEMGDHRVWTPVNQWAKPSYLLDFSNPGQIEEQEWLAAAIAEIPSAERRAVIVYTYFYALSDEEIALKLGKSKGAVHTLRHRALKQLYSILNKTTETANEQTICLP